MSEKKSGRLSLDELDKIKEWGKLMTPQAIADKINRRVEPVIEAMKKFGYNIANEDLASKYAEYDIVRRHFWKDIQEQFEPSEQETFITLWGKIIDQFRKDVLPTEELTIVDAIKMEILMNRCLRNEKETKDSVNDLQKQLDTEKMKETSDQDRDLIFQLEKQIATLRAGVVNYGRDFKDFQKEKTNLLTKLKATRDMRIKAIEGSRDTFAGLLSKIAKDPSFADAMSKDFEKRRIAAEEARKRLSDYLDYGGEVDQPLLTPESVL